MRVATGNYTGNGASQSFSGFGFAPVAVCVFKNPAVGGGVYSLKTTSLAGATTLLMQGNTFANGVTLDADGFSVGTSANVNESGVAFYYVALGAEATCLAVGSYAGDGNDNRNITVGLQPDVVMVIAAGSGKPARLWHASKGGDYAWLLAAYSPTSPQSDRIQGVGATTFQVGTHADVNASGTTYHYLCLKARAGNVAVGSYTGNGADDRDITMGDPFAPLWALIQDDAGNYMQYSRSTPLAGDNTFRLAGSPALLADLIQALNADGFQVGAGANGAAVGYYYVALKDEPLFPVSHLFRVPFEAHQPRVQRKFRVPAEARRRIGHRFRLPFESRIDYPVSRLFRVPFTGDIGVGRLFRVPVEAAGTTLLQRTFRVPVEALGAAARLFVVPVEAESGRITRLFVVPVDAGGGIGRPFRIELEAAGTIKPGHAFRVPVEILRRVERAFRIQAEAAGEDPTSFLDTFVVRAPVRESFLDDWLVLPGLVVDFPDEWVVRSVMGGDFVDTWDVVPAGILADFSDDIQLPVGTVESD